MSKKPKKSTGGRDEIQKWTSKTVYEYWEEYLHQIITDMQLLMFYVLRFFS